MISIVIPTYEMNGKGSFFIRKNLEYISNQKFDGKFEVVVSDHSLNDDIKNICDEFNNIDINYIVNENDRGSSSANFNNGINNCKYNLIKFLMQDDYLYDDSILNEIVKCFEDKNVNWVVNSCINGESPDNPKSFNNPYYNEQIIYGYNTIGSPSCLSIRKTVDIEYYDPNFIWLMDCDYYKRLFDKWGHPKVSTGNIFITQHENQLTNLISTERKLSEHELIKNKYNK